jgi:hypothetical protein
LVVTPAWATPWSLAKLMDALAHNRAGVATFEETKFISVLDQPVVSSGELRFAAPDHLEKVTLKPRGESMILDGDRLTLQRGSRRKLVSLAEYPEVAGMVESMRATLAGDRKALERAYYVGFDGSAESWNLTLIPTVAAIAKLVAKIHMHGSGAEVREIDILQADGDHSRMTIHRVP